MVDIELQILGEIESGTYEKLKSLLDEGFIPDIKIHTLLPLHAAIYRKSLVIVKLLVKYNFDIDFTKENYVTPLQYSIRRNTSDIFRFLLESGAKYEKDNILKFIEENFATSRRKFYIGIMEEYEEKRRRIKPARNVL
jgi:ankyrin repeat protein